MSLIGRLLSFAEDGRHGVRKSYSPGRSATPRLRDGPPMANYPPLPRVASRVSGRFSVGFYERPLGGKAIAHPAV